MAVPFPFSEKDGKNKKRPTSCQADPRGRPIMEPLESVNPVMRISALHRGQAKKAALGTSYRRRVGLTFRTKPSPPAPPNERMLRLFSLYRGGYTRPSESLAGWQSGYTHLKRHGPIFLGHQFGDHAHAQRSKTVGARSDPPCRKRLIPISVHGCAVNTNDRASGLIRFHAAGILLCGPNGWGDFA